MPESPVPIRDSDQNPGWAPIDSDGKIIGDVPWKFFEPSLETRRGGLSQRLRVTYERRARQ